MSGVEDDVRQLADHGAHTGLKEDRWMRPSRFTETDILQALRQVRTGTPAVETCRRLGITQTTFYRWRKKFDVATKSESHELKDLRTENHKLKLIIADLMLAKS